MLYIVATPIGNLGDITIRALEALRSVDYIACEDTRQTSNLLSRYEIRKPLLSYYEHNKYKRGPQLLSMLERNQNIALVSDGGTPGISDPGFYLVRQAMERAIPITVLPGACAAVAALSVSGIPASQFIFEGFLPRKSGARRKRLEALKQLHRTIVLYESPHRMLRVLSAITEVWGSAQRITIARELTKKFEEIISGPVADLERHFNRKAIKGEFVIIIETQKESRT